MKPGIFSIFSNNGKPVNIKFRNKVYVFLICIAISTLVWALTKLSGEQSTNVRYETIITKIPDNKLITNAQDIKLYLELKGKGISLYTYKLFTRKRPLIINLDNIDLRKSRFIDNSYLLTSTLHNTIQDQLDLPFEISSIEPDSIILNFEDILSKEIKIIPNLDLNFAPQYLLYDSVSVNPQYITISGPASIVDTIDRIYTARQELTGLKESISTDIQLLEPIVHSKVQYSINKVKISIPVEQFTETSIDIPIIYQSDDASIEIKTFPESIKVTFLVALKDYKKVNKDLFRAIVQYNSKNEKAPSKLKVILNEYPSFIKISKISPEKVEYILMNK